MAWAATAFLVPLILGLVATIGTIDLTYHVRTGADIVRSGSLPEVDTYTFSVAGRPWVDQQWGAQLVFHAIFDVGRWEGLVALQGVLSAVSFGFVYLTARDRGASPKLAAILTLGGFLIAYGPITLRPQLLALPLFTATLWLLARRHRSPRGIWAIPALAAIAANVHGSFVLFPLVVVLEWLNDVVEKRAGAGRLLVLGAATGAATLINPYGIGAWTYAIDLSTNPVIRESITEWAPLTLASPLGAVTIASVLVLAGYFGRRTQPVPWVPMLTLGIFFVLALSASRSVLWWGAVAPVAIAAIFSRPEATAPRRERQGTEPRGPAAVVVAGLLVGAIALLPWWRGVSADQVEAAPVGVTEALAQLPSGARIFAHQPWGSWFIFAIPDRPVFVDSRIEIVPRSVWDDYFQVAFAGARWEQALHRWDPDAVVAERDEWDLIPILRSDPEWDVLYEDEDGVVFVPEGTG